MAENLQKTSLEKYENQGDIAEETHAETEHEMTQEEINDKRKTAKELEPFNFGIRNVGDAFDFLLKKGQAGENVFMRLNGKKVYSFGVKTEDDLYLQYYGMTKSEKERDRERYLARREQEKAAEKEKEHLERLERVSKLTEEGEQHIKPECIEEWKKIISEKNIDKRDDQYDLLAIDDALTIIKMIECDISYKYIQEWLDKHRRIEPYYGTIIQYVLHFSKDSKDFDKQIRKTSSREV